MPLDDLTALQMSLCVSNKLNEVIWSHLRSFGVISYTIKMQRCSKNTVLSLSVSTTDIRDSVCTHFLLSGSGLNNAMKGWIKHSPVVTQPRI